MKKLYQPGWRTPQSRGKNLKRSRFLVGQLKFFLPLGVLVALTFIFLWPQLTIFYASEHHLPTMERILKTNPGLENKVIHPKFDSLDKKGRPFLVEAEYALHVTPEKTDLINPSGQIKLQDDSTLSFTAKTGFYYKETEMLELIEDVHFKTDKGYDLTTISMKLFPKENRGEGNEPVHGTGPSGETIIAEGFKITDKGDKIDFLGKTQISLPSS